MKPQYNVMDLFCGCGGASLSLKLDGHKIVAAVDNDPVACEVFEKNVGLKPLRRNLRYLKPYKILEHYGLKKDDVDIIIGCPPCQGFSSLRRTRYPNGKDKRKGLVSVFIRQIKEIRPKAVIFENVPGIAGKKGMRYYLKRFLYRMEKMGYKTIWKPINMANYGIPQFRKRVVVLCVKDVPKPPSFLPETHSSPKETKGDSEPWITVRDTIENFPPLKPGESCSSIPNHIARNHSPKVLKIIKNIPKDGGSRRSLPPDLWLPCHLNLIKERGGGAESVYGRMSWDKPAPTITCRCTTPSSGRFLHPNQDRAITPREAASLQTFPDDFEFPKIFTQAERLIGNAVPPTLTPILVKSFEEIL